MAELILTDKEKADKTYLEWDDDALGKLVRIAAVLIDDKEGNRAAYLVGAALLFVGAAKDANAEELVVSVKGCTIKGKPVGDWKVTAELVERHAAQEQGNA